MLVHTEHLNPSGSGLSPRASQQVYCCLDSMVTVEVWEELQALFPQRPAVYDFERALQAPYLDMMLHGFAVDERNRRHAAQGLRLRRDALQAQLDEFAEALGMTKLHKTTRGQLVRLNSDSPLQMKELFYEKLGLPPQWVNQKGVRRVSCNREALEKLELYLYARPLISCVLRIRDLDGQLEVLETEIDADGRWRAGYNIAGTETGRSSSSINAKGTGGNAQNLALNLRYIFVADQGHKLGVIDLEQVEARDVGYFCGVLFGDWSYLDACEGYDLHTSTSKLVWPTELPWTGDAKLDKKLCSESIYYREFDYRFMAKRGSHLTNYIGQPWTGARAMKIPIEKMRDFQDRYLGAFPCIPRWWQWTAQQVQTKGYTVNPFGRKRYFFGRPDDDATLREAVASLPQGTTADRMNLGMWRVWKYMPEVRLLANGFDSIVFQFKEKGKDYEQEIIGRALELIKVELRHAGRSYIVPGEAKIGWNWGPCYVQEDVKRALAAGKKPPGLNPDGLKKWSAKAPDSRVREVGLKRTVL